MAKRRSLSERILGSDAYTALPFSAQALYVQLLVAADDEGMVGAPRRVTRSIGATEADLAALASAGLVLLFASGICAVTHFHECNYIPESRRRATAYAEEHAQLAKDEKGAYYPRQLSSLPAPRRETGMSEAAEVAEENAEDMENTKEGEDEEVDVAEEDAEDEATEEAFATADESREEKWEAPHAPLQVEPRAREIPYTVGEEKTQEEREAGKAQPFCLHTECKTQTNGMPPECGVQADGVRKAGDKPPRLLSASPSPPSSFSPLTPLSNTPFIPLHQSSSPISSSSGGVRDALKRLAPRFWGRRLRRYEREELCHLVAAHARVGREDALPQSEMEELLEIAFQASAEANACNTGYVRGVYQNFEYKGIRTPDDYATAEFKRDQLLGRI